ncbi:hypothetical protein [Kribbella deserti]|uniref:ABC transporter permease n=1 Tax=Kribbella deserti TaxID=1926257 RepID=A0ABV6QEQ4_9ACTN
MESTVVNVCAAELIKLRGLRAVTLTIGLTVLGTAGVAMLQVIAPPGNATAAEAVRASVQYAQLGFVLLGVLSVASEYDGSQIHTSLVSVPNRLLLLAGKAVTYLAVAAVAAAVTVAASYVAARSAKPADVGPAEVGPAGLGTFVGAAAYLVLIGLFAAALATIIRQLIAAMVATLALAMVVPPVLVTITRWADYLPSRAGMRLYDDSPDLLRGAAVLFAWLAIAHLAAAAAFTQRDA